jgi:hypothetical protein
MGSWSSLAVTVIAAIATTNSQVLTAQTAPMPAEEPPPPVAQEESADAVTRGDSWSAEPEPRFVPMEVVQPVPVPLPASQTFRQPANLALTGPEISCAPVPEPCVRVIGLPGLSFYMIHKRRFRHFATQGGRQPFDAGRGIARMLAIGIDRNRVSMEGEFFGQLGKVSEEYWIIPWCAREIDGREHWKASWRTNATVVMAPEGVSDVYAACQ